MTRRRLFLRTIPHLRSCTIVPQRVRDDTLYYDAFAYAPAFSFFATRGAK